MLGPSALSCAGCSLRRPTDVQTSRGKIAYGRNSISGALDGLPIRIQRREQRSPGSRLQLLVDRNLTPSE